MMVSFYLCKTMVSHHYSLILPSDVLGPQTYTDCLEHIRHQLLLLNENKNRQIRTHETCATDTNQVQVVINNSTEKNN